MTRVFGSGFESSTDDFESIFMKMHKDNSGRTQPIVSMSDDHLINTIRLKLVKMPTARLNQLREEIYNGFAPEGMDERQRKTLGLRKMKDSDRQKAEESIEAAQAAMFNVAMQHVLPYLIVGMCRDATHLQVRQILIDVTGINGRIDLPQFTTYGVMTEQEALGLTGGHPLKGQGFDEMGDGEIGDDESWVPV